MFGEYHVGGLVSTYSTILEPYTLPDAQVGLLGDLANFSGNITGAFSSANDANSLVGHVRSGMLVEVGVGGFSCVVFPGFLIFGNERVLVLTTGSRDEIKVLNLALAGFGFFTSITIEDYLPFLAILSLAHLVHVDTVGNVFAQVEMIGIIVEEFENFPVVGEMANTFWHGVVRCVQVAFGGSGPGILVAATGFIFTIYPNPTN